MADVTSAICAVASLATTLMFLFSLARDHLPSDLQNLFSSAAARLRARLSVRLTLVLDEFDGAAPDHMYKAAASYLGARLSSSASCLRVTKPDADAPIALGLENGQQTTDLFRDVTFTWRLSSREIRTPRSAYGRDDGGVVEAHRLELSFHKRHRDLAVDVYLPHVLEVSRAIRNERKTLRLYTNYYDKWRNANLRHPATFDALAMEPAMKRAVLEDLERFQRRREYYQKIGRAWKRGYLLYGPPGTGKSSLVAAMANLLKFDVYELELAEVDGNTDLRMLLLAIENRSIVVIEDIDCSVDFGSREDNEGADRKKRSRKDDDKVTLSGLLNFVDGLWSSCGEERIIIFTTNYKERLDPALLRPGRMDMHIYMGYCCPAAFRVLASNYYDVDDHPLFGEIEKLLGEVEVSPAVIAEELMRCTDADDAFEKLVKFLHKKQEEAREAKTNLIVL